MPNMRFITHLNGLRGAALLAIASYVSAAGTTSFLDSTKLLAGQENPAWFVQNVPLLDVPDSKMQAVYYYRWSSYREHLVYTGPQYTWLSTEFLNAVGYAGPYGCINAAAGHHIREGRWIRDKSIGQGLVNFWTAGPGQFPKPVDDNDNLDTNTWGTEYSFWVASAVCWQYLVTGDRDFVISQLDNLKIQYDRWTNHFNSTLGLYWKAPVWDATEYTLASYASSDPYHGGFGYRPTINSYQYGDAIAISQIATLAGNSALASNFSNLASSLQQNLQKYLWNANQQFFEHLARDNNPTNALLGAREIMGYLPWMFDVIPSAKDSTYSPAFAQLQDNSGFNSPYAPLTAENRSAGFMRDAYTGCCHWDGPSWPFATAQTLVAAENLLNDYPQTSDFTAVNYQALIAKYVATQFKNNAPYVAEAHDPYAEKWIYDSTNHSEDYNHSTFVDNIIAGLIGLRPQSGNTLVVNPLVPSSWDHFALENAAYHGHNITVIYDANNKYYGQGAGMKVYVDGTLAASQASVGKVTVQVGTTVAQSVSDRVNIAANPLYFSQGTQVSASYTSPFGGDDAKHVVDGSIWRVGIPENARWTTYNSANPSDWIAIDLRRSQAFSNVVLYFYADGAGVALPSSYDLQYLNNGNWVTVPNQSRTGILANNAPVTITFPEILTQQLRIVAPNKGGSIGWGVSEFQVWTAPIFFIQNFNSGKLMCVQNVSKAENALVQQYEDNSTPDHLWRITKLNSGWFKIANVNSGLLLAVQGSSTANSTNLVQQADTGAANQLWRLDDRAAKGQFIIRNKNSGQVAGVDRESTQNSAQIVQYPDTGTPDHLWELLPSVPRS